MTLDQQRRRKWEYTVETIAEVSGVSIHTVRDHIVQGILQPDFFQSVVDYCAGYRTINRLKQSDVDEWGEPIKK